MKARFTVRLRVVAIAHGCWMVLMGRRGIDTFPTWREAFDYADRIARENADV